MQFNAYSGEVTSISAHSLDITHSMYNVHRTWPKFEYQVLIDLFFWHLVLSLAMTINVYMNPTFRRLCRRHHQGMKNK